MARYFTFSKVKTCFLLLILFNFLPAQVGIGTSSPQGTFHVDPKKNTNVAIDSTKTDDFIVDSNGNAVVGGFSPQAKLDVRAGRIAIRDGSEGQGKILVSDANGKGTWTTPEIMVKPHCGLLPEI
ncbi:hypothetical protein JI747_003415 [Chryseobacterium sp. RG1]|uniref:Uncharacterized protein n=1 Tax=Chryseobacterium tagetis TaxID=2801334 RepID=A0ABS7ZYD7_9FLAO|nr:hypothetical protein [Chryseobacterium tagetis]MCA6066212.1 hypothetical protein [Chryseobacterium tagetis]